MKKKDNVISANYLEKIPMRPEEIGWSTDEKGIVTLDIENTGVMNRIAQKLFQKSHTFIWMRPAVLYGRFWMARKILSSLENW